MIAHHALLHTSVALSLVAGTLSARAQTAEAPALSPEIQAKLEQVIPAVLKSTGTPSVEVAIAKGGKVVYAHAFGLARVNPPAPATSEMIYRIASISKQFTAAAAMLLVERGKLRLDDPVSTWFPEFSHSHEITLRMLLNQVSGYSDDYTEDYLTPTMAASGDAYAIAKEWTGKPLDFVPGTKWQYSNTNFGVAGLIVQKVAGEPFFAFVKQNLLLPAGITDALDLDQADMPALPVGYVRFGFAPMRPAQREGKGTLLGDGQLAMTATDLARWDTVVMQRRILKPESWQLMESEYVLPDGSGTSYGLGLQLGAHGGRRVISHSGEVEGFVSLNTIYPREGVSITLLTNAESSTGELSKAVETAVFAPAGATPAAVAIPHNAADEALVGKVIAQLQHGSIDRGLLTDNLKFYFTAETIADYKSSLAPFGAVKSIEPVDTFERGGMTGIIYKVQGDGAAYGVFTYFMPDGKLDQFLLEHL